MGVRLFDVVASAAGLITPFNMGVLIRLVSEPTIEDSIYLSDVSAGNGTNVAPALAIFLGIVYEKIQIAGVWYGYLLPEENVLESPGDQVTLSRAYATGNVAADQTFVLLDADGGGVVVDGTAVGFTGAYALDVKGTEHVSLSLAVGIVTPTARIHVAASTATAGTASLKIPSGVVLTVTEAGAVEADSNHIYWTNGAGTRLQLDDAAAATLAAAYANGSVAADQTLALLDTKGGGFIVDGTAVGFTGASTLQVKGAASGLVDFPRVGGLKVVSSLSVAAAAGATWNEIDLQASTLTLTGGPATATAVVMVRVRAGIINGAGNSVTDAYDMLVDAGPAGTATITRSWSLGSVGAIQARSGVVLGTGFAGAGEADLVVAPGATSVSVAGSGRLGYLAGATQKFVVSQNGGAYVPLLTSVTLAQAYAFGSVPTDQTIAVLDSKGGTVIVDSTTGTFTGTDTMIVKSAVGASSGFFQGLTLSGQVSTSSGNATTRFLFVNYGINQTGSSSGSVTGIQVQAAETAVLGQHNFFDCKVGGLPSRFTVDRLGSLTIAQAAASTGVLIALTVTAGAHTALAATVEDIDVLFDLSATKTWATGDITTQRDTVIKARSYAFAGSSTVTNAATLAISGAPIPRANAIITNPSALLVQSGATVLNGTLSVGGFPSTPVAPAQFSINLVPTAAVLPLSGPGPIYFQEALATSGLLAGLDTDHSFWMQVAETVATTSVYPIFLNPSGGGVGIGISGSSIGNNALRIVSNVTAASTAWNAFFITQGTFAYAGAGTTTASFQVTQFSGGTVSSTNAWIITDAYTTRIGTFTFNANVTNTRQWSLYLQGNLKIDGGQRWGTRILSAGSPYTVLGPGSAVADHILQVTAAGAFTILLPAISLVTSGWQIIIVDSRYNAAVNNITLTPNGADKINNVAANYIMNVSGQALMLVANATTSNWEFI